MRSQSPWTARPGRTALLTLLLMIVSSLTAASPARACTTDYLSGLQRIRAELDASAPDVAADAAELQSLAGREQAAEALRPVIEDLATGNLVSAKDRLDATISVLSLPAHAVCNADSGPARSALHKVYQSPVFSDLDKAAGQGPSFLERVLEALNNFFRQVSGTLGTGGTILVFALILGVIIAFAAWRLRQVVAGTRAAMQPEPAGDGADPEVEWRLADEAALRGDNREAIRRAFRSALLSVVSRGRLSIDPSWTTRELLARATGDADLVTLLAPASATFDHAWYSGQPVGVADWEQARAGCQAIRALAKHRMVAA